MVCFDLIAVIVRAFINCQIYIEKCDRDRYKERQRETERNSQKMRQNYFVGGSTVHMALRALYL